ncbi:MAG: ribonuclease P protein component [Rickettsiales bacterium]|jgi:ribonuclease P protein component|nr:ribonuclease P protein component [Rickettsiales bacterium]
MAVFRRSFSNRADFIRLKESGKFARTSFFIMNFAPAREIPARYGLIAVKKSFGTAISRNRARRLMREWLRLSAGLLDPNMDYALVLMPEILRAKKEDGLRELERAVKKLRVK